MCHRFVFLFTMKDHTANRVLSQMCMQICQCTTLILHYSADLKILFRSSFCFVCTQVVRFELRLRLSSSTKSKSTVFTYFLTMKCGLILQFVFLSSFRRYRHRNFHFALDR